MSTVTFMHAIPYYWSSCVCYCLAGWLPDGSLLANHRNGYGSLKFSLEFIYLTFNLNGNCLVLSYANFTAAILTLQSMIKRHIKLIIAITITTTVGSGSPNSFFCE